MNIDIVLWRNDDEYWIGCDKGNMIRLYIIWEKQTDVNVSICYLVVFGQNTYIDYKLGFN